MHIILVVILTVVLIELFLRLPLLSAAKSVIATAQRAAKTLRRKGASDHWKEKSSQAYAGRMLKGAALLALGLGAIIIVAWALLSIADRFVPDTTAFTLSGLGLVISLIAAIAYVWMRRRFVSI